MISKFALAADGAAGNEWSFPGGTPDGTRYSSLNEIKPTNVATLKELFTIPTGISGGHQGQPLVINIGTNSSPNYVLFYITPSPNKVSAINLSTGALIWSYKPSQIELARGQACCDAVNRGLSYYSKGKQIIFTTLSGAVYALNASTGVLAWSKTGLASVKTGETITAAPIVIEATPSTTQKDLVIIGAAGAENGTRGWIQALDLKNKGASVWKKYNTGSDVDVGITASTSMPTVTSSLTQDDIALGINATSVLSTKKADLGCTSWGDTSCASGNQKWKQGGATVWAWITFDPSSRLVYYGTANPGVWDPSMRPGSNKWASSIFARNIDTGNVVWVNQITPHDGWDFDSMNESIIVTVGGVKQVVHFDKNGFAYKFDAATGSLINASPFSDVTWAKRSGNSIVYDDTTHMPLPDPAKVPVEGINSPLICPSPLGGKEFAPASYSPVSGLFFVPGINFCSNHLTTRTDYIPGTPFVGDTLGFSPDFDLSASPTSPSFTYPLPGGATYTSRSNGELIAWDPVTNSKKWSIAEPLPLWGGVLSTAGNGTADSGLVFYGTLNNNFKAVSTKDGASLYTKQLECGILGNPISFIDNSGHQKIAVFTGVGWLPAMFSGKKCPGVLHIFGL